MRTITIKLQSVDSAPCEIAARYYGDSDDYAAHDSLKFAILKTFGNASDHVDWLGYESDPRGGGLYNAIRWTDPDHHECEIIGSFYLDSIATGGRSIAYMGTRR